MVSHTAKVGLVFLVLTLLQLNFIKIVINGFSHLHSTFDIMSQHSFAATKNQQSSLLRFQWTGLELQSKIAKMIDEHQHNCSAPVATHKFRSSRGPIRPGWSQNYGLGSELHVWGHLLIHGRNAGVRTRTPSSLDWPWWDQEKCNGTASSSLLACYFPNAETSTCPQETFNTTFMMMTPSLCGAQLGGSVEEERIALTEFLFSSVSPLVMDEAERQLKAIFPSGTVPPDLITIHVRWGDKSQEMELKSIETYINAANEVIQDKKLDVINILLCTEDPNAVDAFLAHMPKEWNVFLDHFYTYMLPYRAVNSTYNELGDTSMEVLKGKAGLWAIGSLLVAMEANIFILTTKSNWSRLINEIRQGIVDPRCGNCTTMIDVGFGEC